MDFRVVTPNTNWAAYTPTINGFGTCTEVDFFYRKNGDCVEVRGSFKGGVSAAEKATITTPAGLTVNSAKIGSVRSTKIVGHVVGNVSTTVSTIYSSVHYIATYDSTYIANGVVIADSTDSDVLTTGNIFRPDNGNVLHGGNNRHCTVYFSVPITEWSL